ncbi:hypothetical protein BU14_0175s0003 [Porphyra umbilicalis]|uniref:Uncharacterized protein n=1 Tax=Porphyra umbilicalis TaxID=2786 RepID=A0A1X6P7T1_PORUM|nr:hypothetical protein BU14_0175s0003 [Porphyra umbilicalis]|eukprot:OSX76810.1 hypothetical protein BU14_0175s0003 [Porphyra umbilicalis]
MPVAAASSRRTDTRCGADRAAAQPLGAAASSVTASGAGGTGGDGSGDVRTTGAGGEFHPSSATEAAAVAGSGADRCRRTASTTGRGGSAGGTPKLPRRTTGWGMAAPPKVGRGGTGGLRGVGPERGVAMTRARGRGELTRVGGSALRGWTRKGTKSRNASVDGRRPDARRGGGGSRRPRPSPADRRPRGRRRRPRPPDGRPPTCSAADAAVPHRPREKQGRQVGGERRTSNQPRKKNKSLVPWGGAQNWVRCAVGCRAMYGAEAPMPSDGQKKR